MSIRWAVIPGASNFVYDISGIATDQGGECRSGGGSYSFPGRRPESPEPTPPERRGDRARMAPGPGPSSGEITDR
jgi:hypothetical protein